jgi:hypothetical protein
MLGIGPRWVRQAIESAAPAIDTESGRVVGMVAQRAALDLDQSVLFDQAHLMRAINYGLTVGVFQWPDRSEGSPTFQKRSVQTWLLVAQTKSENPAQTDQLLNAMFAAIGAAWSNPALSGGSDDPGSLEAIRVAESGQLRGVLVLGREALDALGHDGARLEELRGRAHRFSVDQTTIPVIVSFAPQQVLHEPSDKAGAWRDLQLAKSVQIHGACFPISDTESNLA